MAGQRQRGSEGRSCPACSIQVEKATTVIIMKAVLAKIKGCEPEQPCLLHELEGLLESFCILLRFSVRQVQTRLELP